MKAKLFRFIQLSIVTVMLAGLGWSSYSLVHYLRSSPRFKVSQLSVTGLKRVNESQVVERARLELGTNVFSVDLDGIRERVEGLQWVRHALVRRVLPGRIVVKITEREPIGLARIRGEVYEFDAEAAVLEPDTVSLTSAPVLNGLKLQEPEGNQKKVELYRRVVRELGETELSEVHVNDAGEVTVVSMENPLKVNLGTADFRPRWLKYLQLSEQIREQYPEAETVDLRFRNQVIVRMRNFETADRVIWDAEKELL